MKKLIIGLFVLVGFVLPLMAADAPSTEKAMASVPGLELPADMKVDANEGFINIQAKCKGEVKWLVISSVKVKYLSTSQSIIVSVPPQPGITISVFAVGQVDGKLTDFARTTIQVAGNLPIPLPEPQPPQPNPNPNPNPQPPPASKKLHLTFLLDLNQATPELGQLLNSESLRKGVTQRGHWFRLYDIKSPIVAQKGLDKVLATIPGNNALIIQSDAGTVLYSGPIPRTEAEIFKIIGG